MPVIFKITTDIPGGGDAWQVLAKPYQIDNTGYTKMLWYKGTKEKRKFLK